MPELNKFVLLMLCHQLCMLLLVQEELEVLLEHLRPLDLLVLPEETVLLQKIQRTRQQLGLWLLLEEVEVAVEVLRTVTPEEVAEVDLAVKVQQVQRRGKRREVGLGVEAPALPVIWNSMEVLEGMVHIPPPRQRRLAQSWNGVVVAVGLGRLILELLAMVRIHYMDLVQVDLARASRMPRLLLRLQGVTAVIAVFMAA